MKKSDLKDFMIVETGYDNEKLIIMAGKVVDDELNGYSLDDFTDELVNKIHKPESISKIYKPVSLSYPFELNIEKIPFELLISAAPSKSLISTTKSVRRSPTSPVFLVLTFCNTSSENLAISCWALAP